MPPRNEGISTGTEALEATTNSLPAQPAGPGDCPGPQTPEQVTFKTFLLSFVDEFQQVVVYAYTDRCAASASNGTLSAGLTTPWLKEVQGYAEVVQPVSPPIPLPTSQSSGTPTGAQG
jgi:hypothetical protein